MMTHSEPPKAQDYTVSWKCRGSACSGGKTKDRLGLKDKSMNSYANSKSWKMVTRTTLS